MYHKIFFATIIYIISSSNVISATMLVNDSSDLPDFNLGDGVCETATANGLCTLRAAIEEANANTQADTINFDASVSTIILSGALQLSSDISIIGPITKVVLNGNGATSIMFIALDSKIRLENISIVNGGGAEGGALVSQAANLTVINVDFQNNIASNQNGGAIFQDRGVLYIESCQFSNNMSTGRVLGGGALFYIGETLVVRNSSFTDNRADLSVNIPLNRPQGGGAIYSLASTLIANGQFVGNTSNVEGGAVILRQNESVILDSTFDKNHALGNGGGLALFPLSTAMLVTMENVTIQGSRSEKYGGGIYVSSRYSNGANIRLRANGMQIKSSDDGTATSAALGGGGIHIGSELQSCIHCYIEINNSLIQSARAPMGSALYLYESSSLQASSISNSGIIRNGQDSNAAVMLAAGNRSGLKVTNSTIAENAGDGILLDASGTGIAPVEINNTTLVNNLGVNINRSNLDTDVLLQNSILSNNTSSGSNCTNLLTSMGGNLLDGVCAETDHSSDTIDANMIMPALSLPGAYYAIALGHPAIGVGDAASCHAVDQRYFMRGLNCDAGSYQVDALLEDQGTVAFALAAGRTTAEYSVDEFDQSISLSVNRSIAGSLPAEVSVSYFDLEALTGTNLTSQDYSANQELLAWTAGNNDRQNLLIDIMDTPLVREPDERFLVVLHSVNNGLKIGTDRIASVTITDAVPRPGALRFLQQVSASISENDENFSPIIIQRINGVDGAGVVDVAFNNDSAVWGNDFEVSLDGINLVPVNTPVSVAFSDGESSKSIYVRGINNSMLNAGRSFNLQLSIAASPVTNIELAPNNTDLSVFITDDEMAGELAFVSANSIVNENDGTNKVILLNRGTANVPMFASISFSGTANLGTHFRLFQKDGNTEITSQPFILNLSAAEQATSFILQVIDDTVVGDRDITFSIDSVDVGSVSGPSIHEVSIANDDAGGEVGFEKSSYRVVENDTIELLVIRNNGTAGGASIDVIVGDTSTASAEDFTLSSTSLEFAENELTKVITVTTLQDNIAEGAETLRLILSNSKGLDLVGGGKTVVVIAENRAPAEAEKGAMQWWMLIIMLAFFVRRQFRNYS